MPYIATGEEDVVVATSKYGTLAAMVVFIVVLLMGIVVFKKVYGDMRGAERRLNDISERFLIGFCTILRNLNTDVSCLYYLKYVYQTS